jgi:predicted DNA repair protein MutK
MASGLVALLDDVAAIAKLAAASLDDVSAAAGKAGAKAAGVVIDDTAVTPNYVMGFTPDRELPIIWKIALGSLRNKLLFLLPGAIALSAFAPWAVTPLLMAGGAYLCFEAAEKIIEAISGDDHGHQAVIEGGDPKEIEDQQVSGAIRTDFILSAEIMAIALADIADRPLVTQALILALVGIVITLGVYGVVALIVKMDDIGLHLAKRSTSAARLIGRMLVRTMPVLLKALALIGTAAMLWVGGGIIVHGLEHFHFAAVPGAIDHVAVGVARSAGGAAGLVEWIVFALGSAVVGMVVGGAIAAIVHLTGPRKTAEAA